MLNKLLILKSEISEDLLKDSLLKYLDKFEQDEVAEVFYYMLGHYRDKKLNRANGYPAEFHPVEVAKVLDFNAHLMKVALLHDIIEDIPKNEFEAKLLLSDIKKRFGSEVASAVKELTKKEGEDYKKYISGIRRKDAIIVKEADMLTNIRSCTAKKFDHMKYKMPMKVNILLNHLATIKTKDVTLYVHAFYKYYAKIIEEYFRVYESQIKHLKEQYKGNYSEVKYLEAQLAKFYSDYSTIKKKVFKKFIEGLISQQLEARNHLKIELMKRTKEALVSQMPLNSMLISINQNLYIYEKTKYLEPSLSYDLLRAVDQQIKAARLESFRLQHHFDILIQNKKLLREEISDEMETPLSKLKSLEHATRKINAYANMVGQWLAQEN